MKLTIKLVTFVIFAFFLSAGTVFGQFTNDLQYFKYQDQRGVNQFESPFKTTVKFEGIEVRIGAANTLQFQGLRHDNAAGSLSDLESNFNLATSNLDLDVALANGVRTYAPTFHRKIIMKHM